MDGEKREENRIGVAAIIVEDPESVREVNEALHNSVSYTQLAHELRQRSHRRTELHCRA